MPIVYILKSFLTGHNYIGSSREDIPDRRIKAHNKGKTRSTKTGRPWELIGYETYKSYTEARKREIFLKTGQGRKFIKERWQSG